MSASESQTIRERFTRLLSGLFDLWTEVNGHHEITFVGYTPEHIGGTLNPCVRYSAEGKEMFVDANDMLRRVSLAIEDEKARAGQPSTTKL